MMNYSDYEIDKRTSRVLGMYLRKYSVLVMKYKAYHETWKTETTWERYWREMNLCEDMIDGAIAMRKEYGFKVCQATLDRYEEKQNIRCAITMMASV